MRSKLFVAILNMLLAQVTDARPPQAPPMTAARPKQAPDMEEMNGCRCGPSCPCVAGECGDHCCPSGSKADAMRDEGWQWDAKGGYWWRPVKAVHYQPAPVMAPSAPRVTPFFVGRPAFSAGSVCVGGS